MREPGVGTANTLGLITRQRMGPDRQQRIVARVMLGLSPTAVDDSNDTKRRLTVRWMSWVFDGSHVSAATAARFPGHHACSACMLQATISMTRAQEAEHPCIPRGRSANGR